MALLFLLLSLLRQIEIEGGQCALQRTEREPLGSDCNSLRSRRGKGDWAREREKGKRKGYTCSRKRNTGEKYVSACNTLIGQYKEAAAVATVTVNHFVLALGSIGGRLNSSGLCVHEYVCTHVCVFD